MKLLRTRAGFTVMEALVAITIATAAVVLGCTALAAGFDARRTALLESGAILRAGALREELGTWLANAHSAGSPDGTRFTVRDLNSDGHGDEITFTTHNAEPLVAGPAILTLAWRSQHGAQQLIAVVRDSMNGMESEDTVVVSRWISQFRVDIMTNESENWVGHWSSTVLLPRAISVRLSTSSFDSMSALVSTPIIAQLHISQ